MDLMEIRRRIIADAPQLKYAEGNPIQIFADRVAPLKECKVSFTYTQSGSGNPKPDNIRPIAGRSMQLLNANGTLKSIGFGSMVYKGTVDLTTGVLVAEMIDFPILSRRYSQKSDSAGWAQFVLYAVNDGNVKSIISDRFSASNPSSTVGRLSWYNSALYFNVPISQVTSFDNAGMDAWMEEYRPQFVCELKTPQVYQLTPQQIKTVRGANNIVAAESTGISVKYWTH